MACIQISRGSARANLGLLLAIGHAVSGETHQRVEDGIDEVLAIQLSKPAEGEGCKRSNVDVPVKQLDSGKVVDHGPRVVLGNLRNRNADV